MHRFISATALSASLLIGAVVAGISLVPTESVVAQQKAPAGPARNDPPAPKRTEPAAPKPAQIDRNGVLILVRSALFALDQANKTGNYTVLRDIGAPGFQKNSAAQLGDIFAGQRRQGLDLGGIAVLEPQLTLLPQIEPNGLLHLAGFFPSVPTQVNFELLFAAVDRQWKLFGISVNLSNGSPAAPETPPPAEAEEPDSALPPIPPTPAVNPKRTVPPAD